MIDPQVAYDKIAQFKTKDEIAELLNQYGVKGYIKNAGHCAISKYMAQTTGHTAWSTTCMIRQLENESLRAKSVRQFPLTNTIDEFISAFDRGEYPNLVDEYGV
jgi:hypothetical protein